MFTPMAMPPSYTRSFASLKSSRCDTKWKSAQLWNSQSPECQPFLVQIEISQLRWLGHACPERPGKIGEASPAGSTTEKRVRVRPRIRWSDYISDLSWSRLGVESAELSEIAVDREVSRDLGLLPLRPSPEEKRACKWMKKWILKLNTW